MKPPIILLGAHRSGTTWLGDSIAQSEDLHYWVEPRQVWEFGNWFLPDDRMTALHARPAVQNHIRRRFEQAIRNNGKERLCEKTPNNCLRVPFIDAIFPEAVFLFIVRDGRDVLRSVQEIHKTGPHWSRIWRRLVETSVFEFPAFATRLPWLINKFSGRSLTYWGPRPPGWKQSMACGDPDLIAAIQWRETVKAAWRDLQNIDASRWTAVRFEDLVCDPDRAMKSVWKLVELRDSSRIMDYLRETARSGRANAWKNTVSNDVLEKVKPTLCSMLAEFGYEW